MVACVLEVGWSLLPHGGVGSLPYNPLFLCIELYVTVGLVGELLLRLALQRGDFCHRRANWVDTAIALVSIVSGALFIAGLETSTEMFFTEVIVIARVAFRLLRCWALTKTFHQQQQAFDRNLDIVMGVNDDLLTGANGDVLDDRPLCSAV